MIITRLVSITFSFLLFCGCKHSIKQDHELVEKDFELSPNTSLFDIDIQSVQGKVLEVEENLDPKMLEGKNNFGYEDDEIKK